MKDIGPIAQEVLSAIVYVFPLYYVMCRPFKSNFKIKKLIRLGIKLVYIFFKLFLLIF